MDAIFFYQASERHTGVTGSCKELALRLLRHFCDRLRSTLTKHDRQSPDKHTRHIWVDEAVSSIVNSYNLHVLLTCETAEDGHHYRHEICSIGNTILFAKFINDSLVQT